MAKRTDLPGVTSNIQDYGLNVSPRVDLRNSSILIIGTSEDGPVNEPIAVENKDEAMVIFGRFGRGNLVRGIFEAFDASEGTPDIRAMRIGGGTRAYLNIEEKSGSTLNAVTTNWNALRLEARFPGGIYNNIAVGIDNNRQISIYNPKTETWSNFSYDILNPDNPNVDARNVLELATAINSDSNLRNILVATVSGIPAAFEVNVNSASTGVTSDGETTRLNLSDMLENYGPGSMGSVLGAGSGWYLTSPIVSATAGNWVTELEKVYSVTVSEPYTLETAGKSSLKLALSPLDGKGNSKTNTIQALEDYNLDQLWQHTPAGTTSGLISEYVQKVDKLHLDQWPSVSGGYNNGNYLTFTSFMCPDDSEAGYTLSDGITFQSDNVGASGIASGYINTGSKYVQYTSGASGWITATNKYIGVNTISTMIASGTPIIEVSDVNNDDDAYWTVVPYDHTSGAYISTWNSTTKQAVVRFGPSASGSTTAGLLDTNGKIKKDKFVRISYYSVKDFLTEAETLAELESNTTDWKTYFVRGDEILFSSTVPTNIIINQGVKIDFEPGTDVTISDSEDGELSFNNKNLQPGQAGKALNSTNSSVIGLQYTYLPQFPNITTNYRSLNAGTDGTNLSNDKLYTQLAESYTNLENYSVDVIVPMGANIDSTKIGYNAITGAKETVNAQFHIQLGDFLETVSMNVNETMGVIGVESMVDVSQKSINDWVNKLTVVDLSDPLRGANVTPLFDNYRIDCVAFEPYFSNTGGIAYYANGQAAYAGMYTSLPSHVAPTNKPIRNIFRTRFTLSNAQLSKMMNKRYLTMTKKPGRNPVITDAMTLAANGSDFVRKSTVRITFKAMDVVREVCDPYIGQPNSLAHRNAMDQSITRGLQAMIDEGALRAYDFSIISTPDMQVLGDVDINLILVPVFEIRKINVTVKLRKSLPTK